MEQKSYSPFPIGLLNLYRGTAGYIAVDLGFFFHCYYPDKAMEERRQRQKQGNPCMVGGVKNKQLRVSNLFLLLLLQLPTLPQGLA